MMTLFQQLEERISKIAVLPDPDKTAQEFREKIERMMEDYRKFCNEMHMIKWLDEYGNDLYRSEKLKNPKELERRTRMKDPGYTSKFFDVLTWWRVEGIIKFKELGVGANIILGKPTHNGFQERVFSQGVYVDDKLKKG
jgi:uncharacterized protein YnzC (UPF0291/DUF896 family)